jgi:hypothetical protein
MTKEKLEDLRRRMRSHTDVKDIAVCVLTARELEELLDIAEEHFPDLKWKTHKIEGDLLGE